MAENNTKLLPCPFCGRSDLLAVEDEHPVSSFMYVHCFACGCDGPSKLSQDPSEAMAHWNKRSWVNAASVVKAMQLEPPNVHFMDGNSLSGHEAWDVCLRTVLQRLQST